LDERDIILDNLEIAETRYIQSFQPITPSPSPSLRATLPLPGGAESAGDPPTEEQTSSDSHKGFLTTLTRRHTAPRPISSHSVSSDPYRDFKAQISRPRPLKGSYSRNRKGYTPVVTGPTYPPNLSQTYVGTKPKVKPRKQSSASTSVGHDKTPTTYLAPSQYYKLNGVEGVSGGKIGSESEITGTARGQGAGNQSTSLADAIKGRLTGTRFLEVNRDSSMFGKLPLGSKMIVDEHGMLNPVDPSRGPNQGYEDDEGILRVRQEPTSSTVDPSHSQQETDQTKFNPVEQTISEDHELVFVDDAATIPTDHYANPARARPRPRKTEPSAAKHVSRETFPMRTAGKGPGAGGEEEPPHLRLQARQPFHRPISGLDHDALGAIYTDIRHWRAALKAINREIADEQEKSFEDLAEGRNIKGWILVGKGLRFLPGVELIEGRSKEDIRWDELQRGGGIWSDIAFWIAVAVIGMLLGVGREYFLSLKTQNTDNPLSLSSSRPCACNTT
jgi:calcium permeable stress-gated cation channel